MQMETGLNKSFMFATFWKDLGEKMENNYYEVFF